MRGSVYKRGDSWTVRWDLPGPERRQRSKGGFASEDEAERWLIRTLARQLDGLSGSSDRETVAAFSERWLEAIRPDVEPSTWAGYESKLRLYVLPRIGQMRMGDVTAGDLKALYAWMQREGGRPDRKTGDPTQLSARSVQYAHVTIHRMWRDAVRWGAVGRNPADAVSPPKLPKRRKSTWADAETGQFLAHVEGDRWEALWWMLCDTAARRSEVVRLEWSDVDLRAGTATIQYGKTRSSHRTVTLLPETVAVLREWRKTVLADRLAAGESWRESNLVFVWPDGRPITRDWMSHYFPKVRQAAGVPRIRLHDLRHSWATQALAAGVPAAVVQARLGHESISTTIDFYTDVPSAIDRAAAESVGQRWRARDAHGNNDTLGEGLAQNGAD